MSQNLNLTSSISELQFIVKLYPDTIKRIPCPHCDGGGSFTYWLDGANALITEPCAGCDGSGAVYDGIRQLSNDLYDVRVGGEEFKTTSKEKAALIYNEQWAWLTRLGEEIPW